MRVRQTFLLDVHVSRPGLSLSPFFPPASIHILGFCRMHKRALAVLRHAPAALRCTPVCSGGAPAWPGCPPTHSGGAPATLRPGPAALRFTPVFLGPVHRHRPLPTPPWHPSALRLLLLTFPLLQIGAFSFELLVLIFACPPFRPPPLPSAPHFRLAPASVRPRSSRPSASSFVRNLSCPFRPFFKALIQTQASSLTSRPQGMALRAPKNSKSPFRPSPL